MKIARHATGRQAVVVFDHAYHGRTNLTMALTAKAMPYKHGFGPFAGEIYRVPMSYPFRDAAVRRRRGGRSRSRMIEKQVGADKVAAVLIEPIQGEGGFIVPAPGFLPALSALGSRSGRAVRRRRDPDRLLPHRRMVRLDHEGVEPDLVTTAKGIAGGLPLAAVTGRAELMDAVHVGGLGGTYGGNPIACAAALASIETMRELDLAAAARRIESVMRPRLESLAAAHPCIGEVRGRGAMLALEIVVPGPDPERPGTRHRPGATPDAARTAAIQKAAHEAGLLLLTCGTYGNVIRFLPPLVMDDATLARALDALESAL